MKITYLGHSCFKLEESTGATIVCDPFSSEIGYSMPKVKADGVTISHSHYDHADMSNILGNPKVFLQDAVGGLDGVDVTAIPSFHDGESGALRGQNTIFKIRMDGITICHMGDIGEECTAELIEQILPVDVLLIPVGGNYTIDAAQAKEYVDRLLPRVVIPMHYKTKDCKIDIDRVDEFLRECDKESVVELDTNSITLERDDGTFDDMSIVVLKK